METPASSLPVLVAGGGIGGLSAALARAARTVLSSHQMGRLYHTRGAERLVRNQLWCGRSPERFYDALERLYGWRLDNCGHTLNAHRTEETRNE